MRRMVRDVAKRSTPPEETIKMWQKVCDGERKYIDPYRDDADYKIDSSMEYEPCIFHGYLWSFMYESMDEENHQVLEQLWDKLMVFRQIRDTTCELFPALADPSCSCRPCQGRSCQIRRTLLCSP